MPQTNILLLGANGQVGWELRRALAPLGDVTAYTRAEVDLTDLDHLRTIVQISAPHIVVNAAAYTAVDKAESEQDLAWRINADAVAVLAEEAAAANAWMVHYSTDYVFDGLKMGAYEEHDTARPVSVYGASKLRGEQAVRAARGRYLIFRTSWVYAPRGKNFPRTMLNLARTRDELTVVDDQVGAPTSADLIADVTALALRHVQKVECAGGTYHLTATGETSWYDYARLLLRKAAAKGYGLKAHAQDVLPIASADYPTAAQRIANSRLSTDKLQTVFGLTLPSWEAGVDRFLDEFPHESPAHR
jgi:dTDP-4-dehydrorhamnose reductase